MNATKRILGFTIGSVCLSVSLQGANFSGFDLNKVKFPLPKEQFQGGKLFLCKFLGIKHSTVLFELAWEDCGNNIKLAQCPYKKMLASLHSNIHLH